ncbi:type I-E CRISPR-associated protein Cse1/CasA [Paenibacillus ginsengihumi]|uniref:type I-E CRISPR-associated protein Cse1/CasA n=1 Tax=Paenibacillus ginsengihumi TaxID=431596 RepID=UPI000375E32B|nr:type I-E CRISPR-associated protein Cse1/CasA [Paenibacillus ginsengihumi]
MTTEKAEFNLLREPWIVVMKEDGFTEEVGLLELFARAHQFRGLAGELPTQDIAVLRLLLAILHCVYGKFNLQGVSEPLFDDGSAEVTPAAAFRRWQEVWEGGQFSHPILRQYLEHFEDRFWLFHPERPFYQVPGLDKATDYSAAKLNGELAESGNKIRLFSSRSGETKGWLTYAEAARWLLYVNGYDDTSAKPKGKNLPSPGAGWLGKLGLVVAVGNNLFETLMLNLTLLRDGQTLWEQGDAIWEQNEVRTEERCEIAQPNHPAALLTLQSRRLQLKRSGGKVIGYSLLGGDFFPPENAFAEQMTVWRKSKESGGGPEEYKPRRHDPSRQVWRDFAALFANSSGHRSPGVVSWVKQLNNRKIVNRPLFRFQIAAVKYGDKDFFIDDVFSDGIAFHGDLLDGDLMEERWIGRILQEIETTELLVGQVGQLAQNIARVTGDSDANRLRRTASEAREQAYYRLDRPFRKLLEEIDPAQNPDEMSAKWWEQAQRIVRGLGRELVEQCGLRAYAERSFEENGQKIRYSVPQAYNQFLYRTANHNTLKGGKKGETVQSRAN